MSLWRQGILSVVLVVVAVAGAASLSETTRALLARIGIDASPLALAAVDSQTESRRPRGPVRVIMAEIAEARAASLLRTIGTGRALRSVTLFARAQGILTELNFRPGEPVKEGDILAALDQEAERIALSRAELALDAAKEDVERLTTLAGRNAAAQVTLDGAKRALQRAELDVTSARLELERRLVRAPFDGVPGLASVEIGDFIRAETEIGVIDDRSRLRIDLVIPERFAALVHLGQPIEAETVSRPGVVFSGEIAAIDNQVDARSRTLRVQAVIENENDLLRPGFSFSVTLRFAGESHASVPALALQWEADGAFVWVVRDGAARPVKVEIVERRPGEVLVKGELAAGETVVTEGVHNLRPGVEVASAAERPRS